jgi:hypothetical protein
VTPPDLDAIEARCSRATGTTWWSEHCGVVTETGAVVVADMRCDRPHGDGWESDQDFTAHARTDVPALLTALRASLAREQAAALTLDALRHDVDAALRRRREPGGMQAGVPKLAAVPLSALTRLERELSAAWIESTADAVRQDLNDARLKREAAEKREAALREALAGIDERAASLEQDARTGTHGDACPRRIADDEHHRACEREDCDGACWDGVECDDCYAGAMIAGLAEIRTALRALATGEVHGG